MYRIKSTGEIKSQGEVRKMFPNVSMPKIWDESVLNYLGIDPIFESPTPTTTRYQTAYKDGIEFKNGKWMWAWIISEMDDETKSYKDAEQASNVRAERDSKLANSDWTQVADAPVDSAAWAVYRQSLRDIPSQAGFPWEVTWPTQPE